MKTKLYTMASMLAVFNLNAIEIGPTGSGVELGGFVDYSLSSQDKTTNPISTAQVELNLDYSTGPVSFSLDYDLTATQVGQILMMIMSMMRHLGSWRKRF